MLQGFVDAVRQMVAQAAAAKFFEFLTGGFSGSGNKVVSAIGGFFTKRAAGGPVSAGRPYVVGEKGPELFVPSSAGQIVPNGAGGMAFTYHIDARGSDADRILTLLPPLLRQTEERTLARVRDLQRRGRMA